MMIFHFEDWASFLRATLNERQTINPKYSLRSFAKSLAVSPGFLSLVMHGKRQLSPDAAHKVAGRLKYTGTSLEYLSTLAQFEVAATPDLQRKLHDKLGELRRLHQPQIVETENFTMIKDWYHIPILEMTYLDDFEFTPKNVARRLGIPAIQAEVAIDRLVRLDLLRRLENGTLEKTDTHCVFRTSRINDAFASFHRQMIAMSIDSLDNAPMDERIFMTQTFCIDANQIDEAKAMTREYIQKMAGMFDRAATKSNAYQLNVQFFNLTNSKAKAAPREK